MPGLRDILDAATPREWLHQTGPDDDWGFVALGESGGHGTYGFEASHDIPQAINDARLIVLAPELAARLLRVQEIVDHAAQHSRDPIDLNYIAIPRDDWELLNGALARLDQLGKEEL